MTTLLFSCENATCAVPEQFREIFRGSEDVVSSTRGWEPGSLNLAQGFAMKFRTPLVHADVTRLLIDFEQDGDARWSEFSLKLPEATRTKVVDRHERPYRLVLEQRITEDLRRNDMLLHVMVHTDSATDGLLMLETPAGAALSEKFARAWRARLIAAELDVRQVSGSGSTPLGVFLTEKFPTSRYAQIRLSVSQTFFLEGRPWRWETLKKLLLESLGHVVTEVTPVSSPASPSTDPN
jgi:hypothetical protein